MSEKPRGTLSLPKRTIIDEAKPNVIEVCESCADAKFKWQCHAFKSELNRYKIPASQVADYSRQQTPQGFNGVVNGAFKAGYFDVAGLIKLIKYKFGEKESENAKTRIDEAMTHEHLKIAKANSTKISNI